MSRVSEAKKRADRRQRVKRTIHQALIVALVMVYPALKVLTDWNALFTAFPALSFVAFQGLVTYLYNRVKPA